MVSSIYYARIGRGRGDKKICAHFMDGAQVQRLTEIYKIESQQINIKINI
jgi:hypothetical protein